MAAVAPGTFRGPARPLWLNTDIIPSSFHYAFCPSAEAWKAMLRHIDPDLRVPYPTSEACCTRFLPKDGKHLVIVTVNERYDAAAKTPLGLIAVYGCLVHEAVHVFEYLCQNMDEAEPSSEFRAYAMQRFALQLMSAYRDTRLKPPAPRVKRPKRPPQKRRRPAKRMTKKGLRGRA